MNDLPLCPMGHGPMKPTDPGFLAKYPGTATHACEEQYCRARAWIGVGGEDAITRTLDEAVLEIHLRTPPLPTSTGSRK